MDSEQRLAELVINLAEIKEQKREAVAAYNTQIQNVEQLIEKTARNINQTVLPLEEE